MKPSSRMLLLAAPALLLACAGVDEQPAELEEELADLGGAGARVMTQNMYVGLDVYPLAFAPFDQLPFVVADGWQDFLANRAGDRVDAIATEIALVRPHLIGLQEVTRIYEQFPSDAIDGQFTPNATDEHIDFLAVLLEELASRGLDYEVAVEQPGADIEVPRFDGMVDGVPTFSDVRAKFADVILRRAGTQTTELFAVHYTAALPFPPIPGTIVPRNAVGVTAELGGQTVRLVSTHLEPLIDILPDDVEPQFAQVAELIQLLATSFEPELPTIVLGDFNSPAETGRTYQEMTAAGFADLWLERAGLDVPGFTCCQEGVLTHPDSVLFERIDHVWTKGLTLRHPVLAFTIGDLPFFRTRTEPRLWPSDHAGVIAGLRF